MPRVTRQRTAILSALKSSGRPLSPAEIREIASDEVDGLNLATVYRNLKVQVEHGEVMPVEVLGQPDRYEMRGLDHHHHFLCVACDRVFDLTGCPGSLSDLAPTGFKVEHHELILRGTLRILRVRDDVSIIPFTHADTRGPRNRSTRAT